MSIVPILTAAKLLKILKRAGFVVSRIKGSHYFLEHPITKGIIEIIIISPPSEPSDLGRFFSYSAYLPKLSYAHDREHRKVLSGYGLGALRCSLTRILSVPYN